MVVKKKTTKKTKLRVQRKTQEMSRLGSALRALGGLGGSTLGGMVGQAGVGNAYGTSLGALLSKWLGSGDYTVSSNTILNRAGKSSNSIPMMHNDSQSVIIRHKEYLGEVRGAQSFTVRNSFEINPGSFETFPWLSGVAARFQEYRIRGMVFHYVPSSGNAVSGTNAALGTVMIQTSYRSNDSAPASKTEILNEYWSSEGVPTEAFCHPIECDPKENPFNVQYVRTGNVPAGDSLLLYDLGVTHLCVSGQQVDNGVLGDFWVTYEIELKKPVVSSNVTATTKTFAMETSGTITSANLFTGTQTKYGSLACTAAANTITFPKGVTGYYQVTVYVPATSTFSAVNWTADSLFTNCISAVLPVVTPWKTNYVATSSHATYSCGMYIPDPALVATITLVITTMTGGAILSGVTINPYNPA